MLPASPQYDLKHILGVVEFRTFNENKHQQWRCGMNCRLQNHGFLDALSFMELEANKQTYRQMVSNYRVP